MNKTIGLILLLALGYHPLISQDVIVSLTGQEYQKPMELNFIQLENMTNNSQVMLSNFPAGTTTYRINLSKGIILGGGEDLQSDPLKIQVLCNRPGLLKLQIDLLEKESVIIDIYDINGRIIHKENLFCEKGENRFEISSGGNGMLLTELHGTKVKYCNKFFGDGSGRGIEIVSLSGTSTLRTGKVSFPESNYMPAEFIYSPGDVVRFTAFKAGYYMSSILLTPQNEDSYMLYLSLPCPLVPAVSDFDGNVYYTVQIGTQCWMRENVNSTHYSDGTPMVDGTGVGPIFGDYTTPYWFDYDDSVYNSLTYGKLYTWAAVMHGAESSNSIPSGVQGICPNGWHVPSDEEWIVLELFLGMSEYEAYKWMVWRGTIEGGKLKECGTIHWMDPNSGASNESGFAGLPAGLRNNEGLFMRKKYGGMWWSSSVFPGSNSSAVRWITYDLSMIWRDFGLKNAGISVRCVKD